MARKLRKDSLINIKDIDEDIMLIEGSVIDYISKSGNIYKEYEDEMFFKMKQYKNKNNGYMYCAVTIDGKYKTVRVHRLVAKAFLKNDEGLNIVGHKNNVKHDNNVDNLYWTTVSENTQKAWMLIVT